MESKHFFNLPVIRTLTSEARLTLAQIILRIYYSGEIGLGSRAALNTTAICGALTLQSGLPGIVRSDPYFGPDDVNWPSDANLEPGMENMAGSVEEWCLPFTSRGCQMLQLLAKLKQCPYSGLRRFLPNHERIFRDEAQFNLLKQIIL